MRFNFVDLLAFAYVVYGVFMGMRRGLARELPWAIGWAISLVTGAGLITWSARLLSGLSQARGMTLGVSGMVVLIVGAVLISGAIKGRLRLVIEKRIPDARIQRIGGMIAGGVRALLLSSFLIVFLIVLPVGPLRPVLKKESLLGRTLKATILPVYKAAQEPRRGQSSMTTSTTTTTIYDHTRSKSF